MNGYYANNDLTLHRTNAETGTPAAQAASAAAAALSGRQEQSAGTSQLTAQSRRSPVSSSEPAAWQSVTAPVWTSSTAPKRHSRRSLVRTAVIALILLLAFSCGIIVQAFASSGQSAEAAASAANSKSIDKGKSTNTEQAKTLVVMSGDTLWNIAAEYAPDEMDTRAYLLKLCKLNKLQSASVLHAGDVLELP
ncbi:LysM peptidoglycan-binding domain-containing protein [Paenibacillus sp. FJAT-26967]|uniref:LysM peptidoglycan-binding domain-containing protein n=1 Tax=Paenibacillus sp. FJAT-26967 TaxID=1729690 RepID=UPI0008389E25|nr:LysM peptidoglycan-binding domain-containing protein [Paenibacillus sp. FJAT-26967]